MKKIAVGLATFGLVLFLGGCATMFHGSTQQAYIRSNVSDADIYVNEAYIGRGSGIHTLKKKQNYSITVRKEGCTDVTVPVSKSFDATTLLGIFIDYGLISILIVDGVATGAWQKFDQESYVVDPRCPSELSLLDPQV